MKKTFALTLFLITGMLFGSANIYAQTESEALMNEIKSLKRQLDGYRHTNDVIIKKIDDLMWHKMLEDIAYVDKVRLTGPPRWKPLREDDRFAANPLQFYSYVFIPKSVNTLRKYPLIVCHTAESMPIFLHTMHT